MSFTKDDLIATLRAATEQLKTASTPEEQIAAINASQAAMLMGVLRREILDDKAHEQELGEAFLENIRASNAMMEEIKKDATEQQARDIDENISLAHQMGMHMEKYLRTGVWSDEN